VWLPQLRAGKQAECDVVQLIMFWRIAFFVMNRSQLEDKGVADPLTESISNFLCADFRFPKGL
jgi:hypothetical protein